jgi:hypothetical protein
MRYSGFKVIKEACSARVPETRFGALEPKPEYDGDHYRRRWAPGLSTTTLPRNFLASPTLLERGYLGMAAT